MQERDRADQLLFEILEAGVPLGVAEFGRVHFLLERLRARGEAPETWSELAGRVAPIVCATPSEQALCHEIARRRSARDPESGERAVAAQRAAALRQREESSRAAARGARSSGRLALGIGLALLLAVAVGLGVLVATQEVPVQIPGAGEKDPAERRRAPAPPPPAPFIGLPVHVTERVVAIAMLWTAVLAIVGTFEGRRRVLERRFSVRDLDEDLPRFQTGAPTPFSAPRLRHSLQTMRLHRQVPSRRLDAGGTLAATLRSGGLPTPVYGRRPVSPEYVLLTARRAADDHLLGLVGDFAARLQEEQVHVERFEFLSDPRRLRARGRDGAVWSLDEVISRHPEHRLLLVDDGAHLLDPRTGRVRSFVPALASFDMPILLTPVPVREWGPRERALERAGFAVLPFSEDGLAGLAEYARQSTNGEEPDTAPHPERSRPAARPYPELLRRMPLRFLEPRAPEPELLRRLVAQLRVYLEPEAFFWLCSLAVFPVIHPELTRHLGAVLRSADAPWLCEERLVALARLPWLQRARMPDWLRLALIRELPPEREQQVRDALQTVLLSEHDEAVSEGGEARTFAVPIVPRRGPQFFDALLAVARGAPRDSPLREYVFLDFMRGRSPLALDVGQGLRERLDPVLVGRAIGLAVGLALSGALLAVRPEIRLGDLLRGLPQIDRLAELGLAALPLLGVVTVVASLLGLAGFIHAAGGLRSGDLRPWRRVLRLLEPVSGFAALDVLLGTGAAAALALGAAISVTGSAPDRLHAVVGLPLLALALRLLVDPRGGKSSAPARAARLLRPELPRRRVAATIALLVVAGDALFTAVFGSDLALSPSEKLSTFSVDMGLSGDLRRAGRAGVVALSLALALRAHLALSWREIGLLGGAAVAGRLFADWLVGALAISYSAASSFPLAQPPFARLLAQTSAWVSVPFALAVALAQRHILPMRAGLRVLSLLASAPLLGILFGALLDLPRIAFVVLPPLVAPIVVYAAGQALWEVRGRPKGLTIGLLVVGVLLFGVLQVAAVFWCRDAISGVEAYVASSLLAVALATAWLAGCALAVPSPASGTPRPARATEQDLWSGLLIQLVSGCGLIRARPDLRRGWLYPFAAAAVLAGLLLAGLDLDFELLGSDLIDDDDAALLGLAGLVPHLAGVADLARACRIATGPALRDALLLQLVSGFGLRLARPDLRRGGLYPIVFGVVVAGFLLGPGDLDYDLLERDLIDDGVALTLFSLGLAIHLVGMLDVVFACRSEDTPWGALAAHLVSGTGLLLARPDLRRGWLYPVAAFALLVGVLLGGIDLDYALLDTDLISDGSALLLALAALAVHLAGALDVVGTGRPGNEPVPWLALLIQLATGLGLLLVRPDLRRGWLYPFAWIGCVAGILLGVADLDYVMLGRDLVDDALAGLLLGVALLAHLAGLGDVAYSAGPGSRDAD